MKSPRSPHDAIVVPSSGPVYDGRAGHTRKERVHLIEPDGSVRSLEVYRVVNVATHPQLKPRVLAGQLHRLEDGRELALPFVYHDPSVRKFALVIPPALAHLEMKEWAALMTEVADDTGNPVPAYVRDGTTVLGLGALEIFLESGVEPDDAELSVMSEPPAAQRQKLRAREQELAERQRLIEQRERETNEQEQALIRMAAELTTREGSLGRREQQLNTARADLEVREAEIGERKQRTAANKGGLESVAVRDSEWQEVGTDEGANNEATVVTDLAAAAASEQAAEVSDSELRDAETAQRAANPPPLRRRTRQPPPPLNAQLPMVPPAVQLAPTRQSPPPLRSQSLAPEAAQPNVARSNLPPPPLPTAAHDPQTAARNARGRAPEPAAAPAPARRSNPPPAAAAATPAARTGAPSAPRIPAAVASAAPGPAPSPARTTNAPAPVMVQPENLTPAPIGAGTVAGTGAVASEAPRIPMPRTSGLPPAPEPPKGFAAAPPLSISVRTDHGDLWLFVQLERTHSGAFAREADLLVQFTELGGRPVVVLALRGAQGTAARLLLDGLAAETRSLLERLAQAFHAHAALYVAGQLQETRNLVAPRETNARAILAELVKPRPTPQLTPARAFEQVLREPPPLEDDDMPFGAQRAPQAATTQSVLDAIRRLERWAEPEKLEQALLVYSMPKHVIDASSRRLLRAAIGFGIALPERLVDLALLHKLADSKKQLLSEQLAAFRQRIERNQNDLDPVASLRNWEKLFAQADEVDLAVEPDLRYWVERSAAESGAPPADLPLSSAELRRDLGDPGRRLDAIKELCRRGHVSGLTPIFSVLEELSPEEVASAVVQVLTFGEQAADGLITALGSPSQHVRHACALGLGQLKLRRSLPALIKQIENEITPSWAEMARALGDFGSAALRNVSRGLKESERRERLMVGLAHLANHGCAEDVKSLETDPDPIVALAARQALARCSRMEWDDLAVRNQQPLRDNGPETRFSQVFYAEVARATG